MTHPLNSLIDSILNKAEAEGALDNLPGAGKPLPSLSNPKDALLDRMMTSAGAKAPIVTLREKILASQARLKTLTDDAGRKAEMKILSDLQMRLAMEFEAHRRYG